MTAGLQSVVVTGILRAAQSANSAIGTGIAGLTLKL